MAYLQSEHGRLAQSGSEIMCRYAQYGPYKDHWACFRCRKAFKRNHVDQWPKHLRPLEGEAASAKCPDCGSEMAEMGFDFKTPRRTAKAHWEVVEFLFRRGVAYRSCGCGGPGFRPSKWAEVPAFLRTLCRPSAGEALLERFGRRQ